MQGVGRLPRRRPRPPPRGASYTLDEAPDEEAAEEGAAEEGAAEAGAAEAVVAEALAAGEGVEVQESSKRSQSAWLRREEEVL